MPFTEEQLKELFFEEIILDENEKVLYEVIETGEWADEGKFQDCEVIFKEVSTGKHYRYFITRSGSYFSHYEYEVCDTDPDEVELVTETVTVTHWKSV